MALDAVAQGPVTGFEHGRSERSCGAPVQVPAQISRGLGAEARRAIRTSRKPTPHSWSWMAALILHGAVLMCGMVWCRYPHARTAHEEPAFPEPSVALRMAAVCIEEETGHELDAHGRGEDVPVASEEDWSGAAPSSAEEPGSDLALADLEIQPAAWTRTSEPSSAGAEFSPSVSFATVKFPSRGLSVMGTGGATVSASGRDAGTGSGAGTSGGGLGSGGGGGTAKGQGSGLRSRSGAGEHTGTGATEGLGGHGRGSTSRDAEPLNGNPRPAFPKEAQHKNQSGWVVVRVEVFANGRAGDARVVESSGFAMLDEAALQAARQWRFRPAQKNGVAVRCEVEVPFQFKLVGRR